MSNGNKVFVKISNQQIYDSLERLHRKMEQIDNKVNTHKILIYGTYSILSLVITVLIAHLFKVGY